MKYKVLLLTTSIAFATMVKAAPTLPLHQPMLSVTTQNKVVHPHEIKLAENERIIAYQQSEELDPKYMGHGKYTINALRAMLPSDKAIVGTVMNEDLMQLIWNTQAEVTRVRFSLASTPEVTNIIIIPFTKRGVVPNKQITIPVSSVVTGWNDITLPNPLKLEKGTDYVGYFVGYEYNQIDDRNDPRSHPLNMFNHETTNGVYFKTMFGGWSPVGNQYGSLAIQLVARSNNFTQNDVLLQEIETSSFVQAGQKMPLLIKARNNGSDVISDYSFGVDIDDTRIATIKNLGDITVKGVEFNTEIDVPLDITTGKHTLRVYVDGQSSSPERTQEIKVFKQQYERKQYLLEHFTSQYCSVCPWGIESLRKVQDSRSDIAWVSLHGRFRAEDIYETPQTDSIGRIFRNTAFPTVAVNRTYFDGPYLGQAIGANDSNVNEVAGYINYLISKTSSAPVSASIDIFESYFSAPDRTITIRVKGEISPDMKELYGDPRLFVYVTEDNLVARQNRGGRWVESFQHENVFRKAIPTVKGTELPASGPYDLTFKVNIPQEWKENDLSATVAIGPLNYNTSPYGYVTDLNKLIITNAWKKKIEMLTTHISTTTSQEKEIERYNAAGQKINKPSKGLNIIKFDNGKTVKVIVKD